MRDYTLYLAEFSKFVNLIVGSGRVPDETDVDLFIDKMWTRKYWAYDEANYSAASMFRGVEGFDSVTDSRILETANFAFKDYVEEVKPILMEKLEASVGVGGKSGVREWDPTPYSVERLAERFAKQNGFKAWESLERKDRRATEYWVKADAEIQYIKSRILEYNRKVVPYQLRKTLHHNLMSIHFSTSNGKCFPGHAGRPLLHTEEDMQKFLDEHVENGGHRALWFTISNTGENYKAAVVDIDFHHVDMNDKEKKRVTKEVAKRLQAAGYPILIQYSGHGYHVWVGRGTGPEFTDRHVINNLMQRAIGNAPGASFSRPEAIAEGLAHIELETSSSKTWAMFFGMHYKPNSDKKLEDDGFPPLAGSGLCRVPLTLDTLETFDPFYDAHPEQVLANFDRHAVLVDNFFDQVEIGYGHEEEGDTESQPPCLRSEGVLPDHPLAVAATNWKKKPDFKQLRWEDALEMFEDKEDLCVTPKFNGALFAIHYKEGGGHKVDGTLLTTERSIVSRASGAAVLKTPVTTIMASKGGAILWENHITREFEDACVKKGVSEALFIGELFEHDAFGVVRGPQAITATVMRKEIDPRAFKRLRYALVDIVTLNGKNVDVEYRLRHAELVPYEGDRVKVVPLEHIHDGAALRLQALWNLHITQNQQEGLVIHHEGVRYKVKRRHTLDAVIISVATNSKPWQDGRKNRHVFEVAVARKTKYGDPTYIYVGKVGWGPGWDNEKQSALFDMVMGEQVSEGRWEHSIAVPPVPPENPIVFATKDRHFVEPRIVVEVEYERLSEGKQPSFGTYYYQGTKRSRGARVPKSGYRFYPQLIQTRRMVGPAVISEIRHDKDPSDTFDIRLEQAEGAGGFEMSRAPVRKNPTEVYGYPGWLQSVANFFPIIPSVGSSLDRVLILDESLSKMKFYRAPQGFPRESPWLMPMEAYRKLWNLSKRSGRRKEFGGYVKEGVIYYGSSHSLESINMWNTEDTLGADFIFHTHPRNDYAPPRYPVISDADLATSITSKLAYGIPWELIVAPHGFLFFRPKGFRKGSSILKAVQAMKKSKNQKTADIVVKELRKEQDLVSKSYYAARKTVLKMESAVRKKHGFVSEHPWWYEQALIDEMNKNGVCNTHYEAIFVPLYVMGPNFRKRRYESIKSNPSTGYFGVAFKRPTFGAGVIGPEGEPMPDTISFDREFSDAIARGRRADPDEKGQKLYPGFKFRGGDGYAFVLGLPISMQRDFTDMYGGPGASSVAMLRSDDGNIRATTEQFNRAYRAFDPQQGANDMSVIIAASMEMPPIEDPESSSPPPTLYDEGKNSGKLVTEMKGALRGTKFTGNQAEKLAHLRTLYEGLGVQTNPPTDIEEWDMRVSDYRRDHADYQQDPTQQSWAEFALGMYPEWELPLLEKGRLLMEAIEAYSLSDEEEAVIRQEYSTMSLDLANPLGNLLAGLDSDEEDEDDEEEDEYDEVE